MFPSIIRHRRIITTGKALLCALVLVTASFALPQPQARAASATSGASGVSVLVPATAQWVNTGISLNNGDQLGITATGSWTPGPTFGNVGPDGFTQPNPDNFLNLQDIGSCASCASTPAPHFAGLIGYIGNAPPPPGSYTSTNILPEAQKVFFVGSNFGISIAVTGTLWLNFNDDAYSNNTSDNAGQVTAAVTDTPSTQPLGGTWISPADGFTVTQGTMLHFAAHAFGGVGGVDHVNFTVWWSALGQNPWLVACKVSTPKSGTSDEYDCDWNLKDGNGNAVPNGTIKVGFDVYDTAHNRILSPNGIHQGRVNPPTTFSTIVLNPTSGSSGTGVTVKGGGWPANTVVDIRFSPSSVILAKATVASDGTFTTSITVPLGTAAGQEFVSANDETTNNSVLAPFTVTAPAKIVIVIQGLTTKLTLDQISKGDFDGFTDSNAIIPFLRKNGFDGTEFIPYSYTGSTSSGLPNPYTCENTFTSPIPGTRPIAAYVKLLSDQVTNLLNSNAGADIYLMAHSMGGVVAFGYLAQLENMGWPSLPNGGHLKGVITLDSPLGGISTDLSYLKLATSQIENIGCPGVKNLKGPFSLTDLVRLFQTTSQPTFPPSDDGNPGSQGAHASILKAILGGSALTNQGLAEEAEAHGIASLTLGNTNDLLFHPNLCVSNLPDFVRTQWIGDEGSVDGTQEHNSSLTVYGREFTGHTLHCVSDIIFNEANHFDVLHDITMENGVLNFLMGMEPTPLKIAPPEP